MTPDSFRDSYESWLYAMACLRAEMKAGRKLSPREMIEEVDREGMAMPSQEAQACVLAQEGRAQEVSALRASPAIASGVR